MFRFRTVLYECLFLCIAASLIIMFSPLPAKAVSSSKLVDRGNSSWLAGDYDQALKFYEEAGVNSPESPYIYFNKGAALYRKGDYLSAMESFEKAALRTKDPLFEAKSRFNLGNCSFREAERQLDSDLKKALELCEKSISHFHDALKLDPGLTEAAQNIEVARLFLKNILDEIKKQEQEAKEREKQAEEFARKLEEIIKRQEQALADNLETEKERAKRGTTDKIKERIGDLAKDQEEIKQDTKALSDTIDQPGNAQGQKDENPVKKHLNNAVKEQEAAKGNLNNTNLPAAAANQDKAVKELKDALESMKNPQESQGGQGEENQQQQQQSEDSQENESAEKKDQPNDQQEQEIARLNEEAQDILDEEKENRKNRQLRDSTGYRDVDKDW